MRDYRVKKHIALYSCRSLGQIWLQKDCLCVKYNTHSKLIPQMMLWSSLPCGVQAKVGLDSVTAAQFWLLHLPSVHYWDWGKVSANSDHLKRTPTTKSSSLLYLSLPFLPTAAQNLASGDDLLSLQGKDTHEPYQQVLVLVRLVHRSFSLWSPSDKRAFPDEISKHQLGSSEIVQSVGSPFLHPPFRLICQLRFSGTQGSKDIIS